MNGIISRHKGPCLCNAAMTTVIATVFAFATTPTAAQSTGYADDFTSDSLRYSADAVTFGDSAGNGTATNSVDGVQLTVDAPVDSNDYVFFTVSNAPGDIFSTTVTMDSAIGAVQSESGIQLEAGLYNDTVDFGGENFSSNGNVRASINLIFSGDGGSRAELCLASVREEGDWQPVEGFAEGGNYCSSFDELRLAFDTEYSLALMLDREAATLTASVNEATQVVSINTPILSPSRFVRHIQLFEFGEGTAAATIHGISTDSFVDNFRTDPIVLGPYQASDDASGREGTVRIDDERARFDVASDGDSYRQATLRFTNPLPDYLEAMISVSSESTLSTQGRIGNRLQGRIYNDTAAGGFNDREGDIYASVQLTFRGDGGRSAEYCMERSNDADGESTLPLLDANEFCLNFGFLPELETEYPASLILDREAGTMMFSLGDEVHVHDIATPILEPGNGYREITVFADDNSVAVGYVDDLRTAADALTAEEIAAATTTVDGSDTASATVNGVDVAAAPTSSSGSSSGGCSIVASGPRDPSLGLLALLATVLLIRRRRCS